MNSEAGSLPEAQQRLRQQKAVAYWLLAGVAMVLIQVLLGGITRLTGSGLSIAEWKPILGAVPPMNDQEWNAAFELYKQKASGQYLYQNSDFTLSNFKAIYFWEWLHREWARVFLSGVFAVGFIWFLVKKYFRKDMILPMIILFVLGALQGAVGWIMVASGLNPEDTHVNHIKLALHFIAALILLCYVLWFALQLLVRDGQRPVLPKLHRFSVVLLCLLTIQLVYGAFMAGLKAAPAAPTWPTINGAWLPDASLSHYAGKEYTGLQLFTDQPLMVHHIHRGLAYLIFCAVLIWSAQALGAARRNGSRLLKRAALATLCVTAAQVLLGILTVLHAPLMTQNRFGSFEWLAELHQMTAVFLLICLVVNVYVIRRRA